MTAALTGKCIILMCRLQLEDAADCGVLGGGGAEEEAGNLTKIVGGAVTRENEIPWQVVTSPNMLYT